MYPFQASYSALDLKTVAEQSAPAQNGVAWRWDTPLGAPWRPAPASRRPQIDIPV